MAIDYDNLIDIDGLIVFKQENDKLYATKQDKISIEARIKTLEDDDSAANTIEYIKLNNVVLTPDVNKAVNIPVPTSISDFSDASEYAKISDIPAKLSDLTNDNHTVVDSSYVHTDNNFTNAFLNKLNNIVDGANVNIIESIKVNNVEQTITNKTVDITATEGTTNGTIKIAGNDIKVHGLGSAAFLNTNDIGDSNVIETIKVNNVALTPDVNKAVNIPVPTSISDLSGSNNYALKSELGTAAFVNTESTVSNDTNVPTGSAVTTFINSKNYQTASQVSSTIEAYGYATETYVNNAIGNANNAHISALSALPATGESNILYLVPDDGGKSNKDMYVWDSVANQFILVGNTEVDLTGYARESQFSVATSAQIRALFAA